MCFVINIVVLLPFSLASFLNQIYLLCIDGRAHEHFTNDNNSSDRTRMELRLDKYHANHDGNTKMLTKDCYGEN